MSPRELERYAAIGAAMLAMDAGLEALCAGNVELASAKVTLARDAIETLGALLDRDVRAERAGDTT